VDKSELIEAVNTFAANVNLNLIISIPELRFREHTSTL
jgi:hypothetical protein